MSFKIDKREKIWENSEGVCRYCKKDLRPNHFVANGERKKALMTVDHVIPRSKGGSNKLDNLVGSCGKCNQKKADSQLPSQSSEIKKRVTETKEKAKKIGLKMGKDLRRMRP